MSQLRYLALGDSYTIGESVSVDERWPEILCQRLSGDYRLDMAPPVIIAETGWTTEELAAGISAAKPAGLFDLVTLLIGVNNQYRGLSIGEYRTQFGELLEASVDFAGGRPGRVIVVSIPDWGVTPFAADRDRAAISGDIDAFNAVNRAVTAAREARYVDITPCSRLARTDPGLVAADGLHPAGSMYRLWIDLILPVAHSSMRG